jgi:hypothetical protein
MRSSFSSFAAGAGQAGWAFLVLTPQRIDRKIGVTMMNDWFGVAAAVSGNTAVVEARYESRNSTGVRTPMTLPWISAQLPRRLRPCGLLALLRPKQKLRRDFE